ncbi:MAG: hypothetical protein M5U12_07910 [Verrucomicrobia bacterium]|nr:hypothetical protein [Verrucomicrobiota bacterium]
MLFLFAQLFPGCIDQIPAIRLLTDQLLEPFAQLLPELLPFLFLLQQHLPKLIPELLPQLRALLDRRPWASRASCFSS